ncbi:MAG: GNAT family N-acetyltransferase [Acidimicrobiia bacterium]
MDVQLRFAVEADAIALAAFRERIAAEGRWIGDPADPVMGPEAWGFRLSSSHHFTIVAVAEDEVAGFASLTETAGVGTLGMAVAHGHRGQGLGGRLLDRAIEEARERGTVHKIGLGVWPHNGAAIRLYLSRGFAVEGRRIRHHRRADGELWDAIKMGLVLDHSAPGSPHVDWDGAS